VAKEYTSNFCDKKIDAANYVTEKFIIRCSELDNGGVMPRSFWNSKRYQSKYVIEVSKAHILLRDFTVATIISAFKDNRARAIRSLRNKNLLPLLEEYKKLEKDSIVETSDLEEVETRRQPKKKQNLFSRLD
jgi:hypothetical protein